MRDALVGCLLTAILVILAMTGGGFVYVYYLRGGASGSGIDHFPGAGVRIGGDKLTRRIVPLDDRIDYVTDIIQAELDADPGLDVGVTSAEGVLILDPTFNQKQYAAILEYVSMIHFVYLPARDQYCGFNAITGAPRAPLALFDLTGRQLWKLDSIAKEGHMNVGDLNGDGEPEFCVIFHGEKKEHKSTIVVFDMYGQEQWRKETGELGAMAVGDVTGDGLDDLCVVNEKGQIAIERESGEPQVVSEDPSGTLTVFDVAGWPSSESAQKNIILPLEGKVLVMDSTGHVVQSLDAPDMTLPAEIRTATVAFEKETPACLAVLALGDSYDYAHLFIYEPDGTLMYDEVNGDYCVALAALRDPASDTTQLLVGGKDVLYTYSPS